MASQISPQADVGTASSTGLALLSATKPLLKALSADNVSPLAVLQVEAIGNCFHSNGEWAAQLPDLLSRATSVRLERLSAWIGWQKGDTASYLSRTSGGRTASLICLFLSNLYSRERSGKILFRLSAAIIPGDHQNSSISQLGDIVACLGGKLACLGFGNLFAYHLTRIRQAFFEAGQEIPRYLASIPTEETMEDFLVLVHKALQDETKILYFFGSNSAGPLLATVLCLCPDDVKIEVNGELLQQGQRSSILFSISDESLSYFGIESKFFLETRIQTFSDDFKHKFISETVNSRPPAHLKFELSGWLSSSLAIAFTEAGVSCDQNRVAQPLGNLIAATAIGTQEVSITDSSAASSETDDLVSPQFKLWLGPDPASRVRETLETILLGPDYLGKPSIVSVYRDLQSSVNSVLPFHDCPCNDHSMKDMVGDGGDHVDRPDRPFLVSYNRECRRSRFIRTIERVFCAGLLSLLFKAEGRPVLRHVHYARNQRHSHFSKLQGQEHEDLWELLGSRWRPKSNGTRPEHNQPWENAEDVHEMLLNLVNDWSYKEFYLEGPLNWLGGSSEHTTVVPSTIQYPKIKFPWTVEYLLCEGRLFDGTTTYSDVLSATDLGCNYGGLRRAAGLSLLAQGSLLTPSGLGQHTSLTMSARPDVFKGKHIIYLRSTIQASSTKSFQLDFLDTHIGFMNLYPTEPCEHDPRTPFQDDTIVATSVEEPFAEEGIIALTLTHWNAEAQFLCCTQRRKALYHIECCLSCAVAQARRDNYEMIIGGSVA